MAQEEDDTLVARGVVPPLHDLVERLNRQTHATTVLVIASQFDNSVRQLVKDKLPNLSKTKEARLFEGYGPLSSFDVKIELAFAMGQIDQTLHRSLHAIRRLRNKFAHTPVSLHFGSQEVVDLLRQFPAYDATKDPYEFFIEATDKSWATLTPLMSTSALIAFLKTAPRKSDA